MTSIDTIGEKEKESASTWFFSLRDRICSEFEKLEHDQKNKKTHEAID